MQVRAFIPPDKRRRPHVDAYLLTMMRLLRLFYTLALNRLQGKTGLDGIKESLCTEHEYHLLGRKRDPATVVMSWILDIFCVQCCPRGAYHDYM